MHLNKVIIQEVSVILNLTLKMLISTGIRAKFEPTTYLLLSFTLIYWLTFQECTWPINVSTEIGIINIANVWVI